MSTSELPPLTKRDTLVHYSEGHAEEGHELTRVVLICLDPESADITFQWALDNFISPKKDLVSRVFYNIFCVFIELYRLFWSMFVKLISQSHLTLILQALLMM